MRSFIVRNRVYMCGECNGILNLNDFKGYSNNEYVECSNCYMVFHYKCFNKNVNLTANEMCSKCLLKVYQNPSISSSLPLSITSADNATTPITAPTAQIVTTAPTTTDKIITNTVTPIKTETINTTNISTTTTPSSIIQINYNSNDNGIISQDSPEIVLESPPVIRKYNSPPIVTEKEHKKRKRKGNENNNNNNINDKTVIQSKVDRINHIPIPEPILSPIEDEEEEEEKKKDDTLVNIISKICTRRDSYNSYNNSYYNNNSQRNEEEEDKVILIDEEPENENTKKNNNKRKKKVIRIEEDEDDDFEDEYKEEDEEEESENSENNEEKSEKIGIKHNNKDNSLIYETEPSPNNTFEPYSIVFNRYNEEFAMVLPEDDMSDIVRIDYDSCPFRNRVLLITFMERDDRFQT